MVILLSVIGFENSVVKINKGSNLLLIITLIFKFPVLLLITWRREQQNNC